MEQGRADLLGGSRFGALGPLQHSAPSLFFFLIYFLNWFQIPFLNILKAFSRVVPKIKVVQNKIPYKFALRWKPRIQMDFNYKLKLVLGLK